MIRNTIESWGWPARTLHWIVAALVIGLFGFGLWMTEVPPREDRRFYIAIHASIGITLLAIMLVRLFWRAANVEPAQPEGTPAWQRKAAWISHRLLYSLTFATLIVGWLLSGTLKQPLEPKILGVVPVPQLLEAGSPYRSTLAEAHEWLAYALIAVVTVHAAAALYHHFMLRDSVMRRMLSGAPRPKSEVAATRSRP
jgi:cytochrome b561